MTAYLFFVCVSVIISHFFHNYHHLPFTAQTSNKCASGLGLETGGIEDGQIRYLKNKTMIDNRVSASD